MIARTPVVDPESLLERADELRRIGEALAAARGGEGRVVVIAAPAGLGKTKLLEAAVEQGRAAGLRPLIARASELERDFGFGVARQLLEAPVLAAEQAARAELLAGAARHGASALDLDPDAAPQRDVHATIHGLYWLLANLAATAPLLVAIDDLQWADEPSLRWLAYTARRLERLGIALVATARTTPEGPAIALPEDASDAVRAAVAEFAATPRVEPAPLSDDAVATLLSRALDRPAEPGFAQACRARTTGNPFLLSELIAELAASGVAPTGASTAALELIVPDRVGETIRRHLARLGPDARALAAAVAILGDDRDLGAAGELAEIDAARSLAAAAELVSAQILADAAPLRFRHPLLRAAVEAQIPALERAERHLRAARLVAQRGAADGQIAAHLLHGPPAGDAWVVERLRAAARSARTQGLPGHATTLLRRALAEPPAPELRAGVLGDLGHAELDSFDGEAARHLGAARELVEDPRERVELALSLALSHYYGGRHAEGVSVLLAAIEEAQAVPKLRDHWLQLEALLSLIGRYDLETEQRTRGRIRTLAETLDGATAGERLVRAMALSEVPGPTADDLYRSTVEGARAIAERPWPDPAEGVGTVAMFLHAGRPDAAAAHVESQLAATRQAGSPLRHAIGIATRGMVAMDLGDLRSAASDFELAYATWTELGEQMMRGTTVGFLALALAGLGEVDRADALFVDYGLTETLPERMFYNPMLFQRGMLGLAQRRFEAAEADFRELGRRHALWDITRPSPPWRSAAALALIGAGKRERAREHAAEELELARVWGTPKAIAFATRALALSGDGDSAIAGLAEAVRVLEDTPWRLDRAQARLDLGSALRRAGRRRDAREALALALDEAHACGAELLAERAADELRASGARPRRRAISGRDALTPSELRVAELAAAGHSNREIAQELFVTMATVETHLSRVYRKLSVAGRGGLAEALA